MNSKENQINSDNPNLENISQKEELINSEKNIEKNKNSKEIKNDEKLIQVEDIYKFGWSKYSEKTNGRFAMIGFLAIILIEFLSQQSFLKWAGIL